MSTKQYKAHDADSSGFVHYSDAEHRVWRDLIKRQRKLIVDRACDEFFTGLEILNLPGDKIPQLDQLSSVLRARTGWEVTRVAALISFQRFFKLLANKQFPCATFIRRREQLDYLQEPDIFHEIFGHCVMLTNSYFADFTHAFGQLAATADEKQQVWLARLYWFTVEFGLVRTAQGERIYGGGIISSCRESQYALSGKPELRPFDIIKVLRTPYRIDHLQPIYYVIEEMKQLYDIANMDIMQRVEQARTLGLLPPTYAGNMKSVSIESQPEQAIPH